MGPPLAIEQVRAEFTRVRVRSIGLLEQAISGLEAQLYELEAMPGANEPSLQAKSDSSAKPAADLLTLKPTIWGMGIDLKELARRVWTWWKKPT